MFSIALYFTFYIFAILGCYVNIKLKKIYFFNGFSCANISYYKCEIVSVLINSKVSPPKVELQPNSDAFNVLNVGHGSRDVVIKEIEFVEIITARHKNVVVYLKPHPAYNKLYEVLQQGNSKNINFINEKFYYPDVFALVHSGSTLSEEYSNSSLKVKVKVKVLNLNEENIYGDFLEYMNAL